LETFYIGFRCYIHNENSSIDKMMKRRLREVLRACLEKLCNLKYLTVSSPIMNPSWCLDVFSKFHPSFCHLKEFCSYGSLFSRIPQWIVHLHNFYDLQLHVKEVLEDDVGMLAQLHSLTFLFLHVKGVPENKIIVRGGGFHVLKRFILGCCRVSCLTFEAGAMPKLEELMLRFNAHGWDNYGAAPAGIEHLSGLKEIFIDIGGAGAKESVRRAAEAALRNATEMHPGRPTAHIECDALPVTVLMTVSPGSRMSTWKICTRSSRTTRRISAIEEQEHEVSCSTWKAKCSGMYACTTLFFGSVPRGRGRNNYQLHSH
jgi:hypothetical protein